MLRFLQLPCVVQILVVERLDWRTLLALAKALDTDQLRNEGEKSDYAVSMEIVASEIFQRLEYLFFEPRLSELVWLTEAAKNLTQIIGFTRLQRRCEKLIQARIRDESIYDVMWVYEYPGNHAYVNTPYGQHRISNKLKRSRSPSHCFIKPPLTISHGSTVRDIFYGQAKDNSMTNLHTCIKHFERNLLKVDLCGVSSKNVRKLKLAYPFIKFEAFVERTVLRCVRDERTLGDMVWKNGISVNKTLECWLRGLSKNSIETCLVSVEVFLREARYLTIPHDCLIAHCNHLAAEDFVDLLLTVRPKRVYSSGSIVHGTNIHYMRSRLPAKYTLFTHGVEWVLLKE